MIEKEKTSGKLQDNPGEGISRRAAIRKMGYAAFASSTMFLLLNNPTKVHAQSFNNPEDPGENPFPGGNKDHGNGDRGSYGSYDWD
jgi:hypothetical protein